MQDAIPTEFTWWRAVNLTMRSPWFHAHLFKSTNEIHPTSYLGSALWDEMPLRLRGLVPVDQPKLRLADTI